MKKPKNSLTSKIWKKPAQGNKVPEELGGVWYDEAVDELMRSFEKEKTTNQRLKNDLWQALNKSGSLNKLEGKIKSGQMPNDLECLLIEVVRI
ncbi:hypothetical protein [Flagellimonas flava]|uniref:hypothetical protein n=1 Tax=Flagellimonas flava TaxID=570519 RepID=UPI003D65B409